MTIKDRILGLDIVRCWAICFVLIGHTFSYIKPNSFKYYLSVYSGFLGVELFFVLSGFLIGTKHYFLHFSLFQLP